jgi:hypothetical protein
MNSILSRKSHFHIYWHGKENSAKRCFDTFDEALKRALEVARPGEILRIDEISTGCLLHESNQSCEIAHDLVAVIRDCEPEIMRRIN